MAGLSPALKRVVQLDCAPGMRGVVSTILAAAGYDVSPVANVDALLSAAQETAAEACIVGYLLPEETGVTVCCHLRESGWRGGILLLSEVELTLTERSQLTASGVTFMGRPFGPHELIQRMRQCLAEALKARS